MTRRNRTVTTPDGKQYRVRGPNRSTLLQGVAGDPGNEMDWRPKFLTAMSEIANMKYACDQAGVSHNTVSNERKRNPAFDRACEESWEIGVQQLELAAWKRAADRSDLLMIFLLKHLKPADYIDQLAIQQTISSQNQTTINHRVIPQDYREAVLALAPPDEEMQRLPEPQTVKITKAKTIDQDPIEAALSEPTR